MSKKSEVISARLRWSDPDEASALEVIQRWQEQGWDMRQILTRALLMLEDIDPVGPDFLGEKQDEILVSLEEVKQALDEMKRGGWTPPAETSPPDIEEPENELRPEFIASLANRARRGKRY